MRLLVLDNNYPSQSNIYGDGFVHQRVKEYISLGHDVRVLQFFKKTAHYVHEGVDVFPAETYVDLNQHTHDFNADAVLIHFYHRDLWSYVQSLKVPCIIWVHGYEALGWYRRLFNYSLSDVRHVRWIIGENLAQQWGLRRLVNYSNRSNRLHFVFPSNWLKKVVSADLCVHFHRTSIIPNCVDPVRFGFQKKKPADVKNLLSIRPYSSRKYANDITAQFIEKLSQKKYFKELKFSLYGDGPDLEKITAPLKKYENVSVHSHFVNQEDIPAIYESYGVLMSPTRQDAQGVSMCEAMSSGLVPLTTNNTAIPEFVEHARTGMLSKTVAEMVDQYDFLYHHPERFMQMSESASQFIAATCSPEILIRRELALIALARELF